MICTALSDTNFERTLAVAKECELAEIRLDLTGFNTRQVKKLFSGNDPQLATCRPGKHTEDERKALLLLAIESGAEYVDVEIESEKAFKDEIIACAKKHNCSAIVSYHNYDKTPSADELQKIIDTCFEQGADVAKVATMVNKVEDNAVILSMLKSGKRIVSIGMGELGKITRVAAPFLGAEFTFASSTEQQATAPGQISNKELQLILDLIM